MFKSAATETARLTGESLDYLINNAALVSNTSRYLTLGDFADDSQTLIEDLQTSFNDKVVGVFNTANAFIPLLRIGSEKKVFTILTATADADFINRVDIAIAAPYSISKAALNVAVPNFNALYKCEGILFMAISPGLVDMGGKAPDPNNAKEMIEFHDIGVKFAAYAPPFKAAATPQESVSDIMKLFKKSSIENGNGGTFVLHLGNMQRL